MYESFGAVVHDNDVEFQLFFPDNSVAPSQYINGGLPNIEKIQVTGDFQSKAGGLDWDYVHAPEMTKTSHPKGILYRLHIPELPEGFYQYKYFVHFKNGSTRWCTDPCTKYGGGELENSAFVVGSNRTVVRPIGQRLAQKDLVIYEMMIDDFCSEFVGNNAPFDAVKQKLDYLQDLGVNAIEFMPWTAWFGDGFNWGYEIFQFFSVEHRYMNDNQDPLRKLSRLKILINELHDRHIHVIMDGVFNHAREGQEPGSGFGYYWLYQNPQDSPFTGTYARGGFFQDLDFSNNCTLEFILDVCKYWLETYQIDGIRFDYTIGYFYKNQPGNGVVKLCQELRSYLSATGREDICLMPEHLTDNRYEAIDDINNSEATGCWFDPFLFKTWDSIYWGNIDPGIMRVFNSAKDFAPGKGPVTYIENHDHASLTVKAGGRAQWWRTQPYAIALFTCPGSPLIHNGQEFGEEYDMPEYGSGRVIPRPLRWDKSNDTIGQSLQSLYKKLIRIRREYPALRAANFYPESYSPFFNEDGYGAHVGKDIVIYHRWGNSTDGKLERFIIVLNFSGYDQMVDVPFSVNGVWHDLLNDRSETVTGYRLHDYKIESHWGRIFYHKE